MFFNKKLQQKLNSQEILITELYARIGDLQTKLYREIEKNKLLNHVTPSKERFKTSPSRLVDRRYDTEPSYPSSDNTLLQNVIIVDITSQENVSYSSDSTSPTSNYCSSSSSYDSCPSNYDSSSDY